MEDVLLNALPRLRLLYCSGWGCLVPRGIFACLCAVGPVCHQLSATQCSMLEALAFVSNQMDNDEYKLCFSSPLFEIKTLLFQSQLSFHPPSSCRQRSFHRYLQQIPANHSRPLPPDVAYECDLDFQEMTVNGLSPELPACALCQIHVCYGRVPSHLPQTLGGGPAGHYLSLVPYLLGQCVGVGF
ncbi:hypothetical protein DSO57_1036869 [Entomophthora muscae]|uniref:Uncharacterized protein n=1 Tax=Entomophthora muscae TaxID=34485 RepID=A0ACC2SZD1_9FUNG|nr:hypothetical protein DSO57_1036869 [Entomophthora muscae]